MSGKFPSRKKPGRLLSILIDLLRDKGVFQPDEESPESLAKLVGALVQKGRIHSFDAEKVTRGRSRGRGRYKALLDLLLEVGILDDEDLRHFLV